MASKVNCFAVYCYVQIDRLRTRLTKLKMRPREAADLTQDCDFSLRGLETMEMFVRGPNMKNVEHIISNRVNFVAIINSVLLNADYSRLHPDEVMLVPLELSKQNVRLSMLQLLQTLLESDCNGSVWLALRQDVRWDILLMRMTQIYHELMPSEEHRHYTMEDIEGSFLVKWENEKVPDSYTDRGCRAHARELETDTETVVFMVVKPPRAFIVS